MTFKIIIQARMGSQRYPGKSMYLFNNQPSLKLLIDSLLQAFERESIIVATSINPENDSIREFCKANNLLVLCGDELNVASRFYEIMQKHDNDYFIRISGDSPLFDYRILRKSIDLMNDNHDIISTAFVSRNPAGMNYEIVKRQVFVENYSKFSEPHHFEHVTKYFYENKELFDIFQVEAIVDNPENYRFAFDTNEDRQKLIKILNYLDKPHYFYTFEKKCEIFDKLFN